MQRMMGHRRAPVKRSRPAAPGHEGPTICPLRKNCTIIVGVTAAI
jgi:hypothetical protein